MSCLIGCRLGQADSARKHLCFLGKPSDPMELQKLEAVEKHMSKCADARRLGDWKAALMEVDAAIVSGADFSPQVRTQLMSDNSQNRNQMLRLKQCFKNRSRWCGYSANWI